MGDYVNGNDDEDDDDAKILLLGDSLTQLAFEGWGATLAHVYQRRADVVNRGCSGYNTEFFKRLALPKLCCNVILVIIFFGANDAALQDQDPHHYVPVEDYAKNLQELVSRVQERYQNPRLLLVTPPPLDHEQRLAFQVERYGDQATGVLERTTENTERYAQACIGVGRHRKVPVVDVFHNMLNAGKHGRFLCDGLHFSTAGHDFVAEQVLSAIATHYPEIQVHADPVTKQWNNSGSKCRALTSRGPYHDEIDHTNIDAAFSNTCSKKQLE